MGIVQNIFGGGDAQKVDLELKTSELEAHKAGIASKPKDRVLEPIRKILGVYDRQLNKPQSGQIPNKTGMTLPNESIPHGSG